MPKILATKLKYVVVDKANGKSAYLTEAGRIAWPSDQAHRIRERYLDSHPSAMEGYERVRLAAYFDGKVSNSPRTYKR